MLKLWHEYFGSAQNEIKTIAGHLHQNLNEITAQVKTLTEQIDFKLNEYRLRDTKIID